MKKQQNFHALRIISLLILAFVFEESYPFVALFLAISGVMITFIKIEKQIKIERTWKN